MFVAVIYNKDITSDVVLAKSNITIHCSNTFTIACLKRLLRAEDVLLVKDKFLREVELLES